MVEAALPVSRQGANDPPLLEAPDVERHAALTDPRKVGELLLDIDGYEGRIITRCALRFEPLVFLRWFERRLYAASEDGTWRADAIERQLSHQEGDEVRGAYNAAEYLDERRRMMQAYAVDRGTNSATVSSAMVVEVFLQ